MRVIILLGRSLLFALVLLVLPAVSFAQIGIGVAITFPPPELPVYDQPRCPEAGYLWTPGYWAWGDDDYYWVPGTWVLAPESGVFWTPGYWGWGGDRFVFNEGYWGPEVGFYGGISYGFGYFGRGYEGGRWDNGQFFYNRAVNNVNVTVVHNVYNTTVVNNNVSVTRVSYNGGNGGVSAAPTPQEQAAAQGRHVPPPPAQAQHVQAARSNQQLRASVNRGKPPIAATATPGAFSGRSVVKAKSGGRYNPPANRGASAAAHPENNAPANRGGNTTARPDNNATRPDNSSTRPSTFVHPKDLPPLAHPPAPNTGNSKQDQKYQQQQQLLQEKQDRERQKLQLKQEQDHQRLAQQKADQAKQQQIEQRHQQQTQQLAQKHTQDQQRLQQKQTPKQKPPPPKQPEPHPKPSPH